MYSTTAYLYQQKQQVLLINNSGAYFDRRWQSVYAKNLKLNRGVDNVILFEFINQDQKPVNISGSTITFRLIDQDGCTLLLAKDLVHLNSTYGRAKVTITEDDLDSFHAQSASYSLERGSGDLWEAVYVDDYSGGRGNVDILDTVYPDFLESKEMIVPSYTVQNIDSKNRVHTSAIYVEGLLMTTLQIDLENFTGSWKAQGSETLLGPWYDIGNEAVYTNETNRIGFNVEGLHNYLRLEINQFGQDAVITPVMNNQVVAGLTVTAGGSEFFYSGANINIEGLGTGATATATVSGNAVSTATVVSGGQGYITTPTVTVDLGKISKIKYR
jgi:hypothetical protein